MVISSVALYGEDPIIAGADNVPIITLEDGEEAVSEMCDYIDHL
ncbi:hypothetical protein ACFLT1_08005 [Bacteroidota bacterium]